MVKTQNDCDRREFLKATGSALAGVGLAAHVDAPKVSLDTLESQRRIYSLNHRWLYTATVFPGATQPQFDDASFARITIPHTNRLLPWNGFDHKSFEFISIYRRHFKLPSELKSRRVFVDFGGA